MDLDLGEKENVRTFESSIVQPPRKQPLQSSKLGSNSISQEDDKREAKRLKPQVETLDRQLRLKEQQIASLQLEKHKYEETIERQKRELMEKQKIISSKQSEDRCKTAKIKQVESKLDSILKRDENRLLRSSMERKELEEEFEKMEDLFELEVSSMDTDKKVLEQEIELIRRDLSSRDEELVRIRSQIDKQSSDFELSLSEIVTGKDLRIAEIEEYSEKTILEVKLELDLLRAQLHAHVAEREKLTTELRTCTANEQSLTTDLKGMTAKFIEANGNRLECEKEFELFKLEHQRTELLISAAENKVVKLTGELDLQLHQLSSCKIELHSSQAIVADLQKQLEEMSYHCEKELQNSASSNEIMQESICALTRQVHDLEAAAAETELQMVKSQQMFDNDIREAKDNLDCLQNEYNRSLAQAAASEADLRNQLDSVHNDYDYTKLLLQETSSEKQNADAALHRANAEIQTLTSSLHDERCERAAEQQQATECISLLRTEKHSLEQEVHRLQAESTCLSKTVTDERDALFSTRKRAQEEKFELNSLLQQKLAIISDLQTQLDSTVQTVHVTEAAVAAAEQSIVELKAIMETQTTDTIDRYQAYAVELAESNGLRAELEAQLAESNELRAELEVRIAELEVDAETTSLELSSLHEELREVVVKRAAMEQELSVCTASNDKLSVDIEAVCRNSEGLQAKCAGFEIQLQNASADLTQLQSHAQMLHSEAESSKAALERLQAQLGSRDDALQAIEIELKSAQEACEKYRLSDVQSQTQAADTIATLEEAVRAREQHASQLAAELEAMYAKQQRVDVHCVELETQLDDLQTQVGDLKSRNDRTEYDLAEAREQLERAAADLTTAKCSVLATTKEFADFQKLSAAEIAPLREEIKEREQNTNALLLQLHAATARAVEIEQQAVELTSELQQNRCSIQELRSQLQVSEQQSSDHYVALTQAENQLTISQDECAAMREFLASARADFEQSTGKFQERLQEQEMTLDRVSSELRSAIHDADVLRTERIRWEKITEEMTERIQRKDGLITELQTRGKEVVYELEQAHEQSSAVSHELAVKTAEVQQLRELCHQQQEQLTEVRSSTTHKYK